MFSYLVMIIYNLSILTPFILAIGVVKILEKNYIMGIIILLISLIMIFGQIILKTYAQKHLVPKKVNVTKIIRSNDSWISIIYITYLAPFINMITGGNINFSTWILILIGVLLVIASHKGLDNPIYKLIGYKSCTVETEHGVDYTLLIKRDVRNIGTVTKIIRLSEYTLMEVE